MSKVAPLLKHVLQRKAGFEADLAIGSSAERGMSTSSANPTTAEMDAEEDLIRKGNEALSAFDEDNRLWNYGGRLVYAVNVIYDPRGVRTIDTHPTPVAARRANSFSDRPIDTSDNPMGPSAADTQTVGFPFRFELRPVDPPTKSTHLARRYGSRRVLTLRIRDLARDTRPQLFQMLLGRGLILFGRVFRVMWIPPEAETAIAIQTDEVAPGLPNLPYEPLMPSLMELISRYNGLEAKKSQAIAKWSSRFQLLTSDSVPAVWVDPDTITVIPDIVSASATNPQRPSTTETLTDGCGLMSEELARRILQHPSFAHLAGRPCVVQVRLRGAKGLLAVMSPEQALQYPGKDVVLRDSMVKCPGWTHSTDNDDPSLSTLDVLRVDGLKVGSSLGSEAIIIMQHNGIPVDVLLHMSEQSLENIGQSFSPQPLVAESEAQGRQRLVSSVYSLGGVGIERRKRECRQLGLSTRVAGLERSFGNDSSDSTDGTELDQLEFDQQDHTPELLAERLYEALLAGFRPVAQDSGWVSGRLRNLVMTHCDRAVADFKIPVEQSVTAFIVPDALGVLAPDEIFVSFGSERPIDPATGRHMHFLEGDCLLYRSPCKLPTDVRKFKAVVRKELFYLRDCIVMSASAFCKASPASFLGGGDYDGDTVTAIWDPALVGPFRNAPDEIAVTPESFERDNFIKEITTVQEVLESLEDADEQTRAINVQYFLLGAALDSPLPGLYSTLHDTAVYERGCGDPQTMRLARMFCHVLDARKSGLQVVPNILKRDRNRYRPVEWREQKKNKGKESDDQFNKHYAIRPASLPPFIMDLMGDAGKAKRAAVLAAFPDPGKLAIAENTAALQEPYRQLWAAVQRKQPTLSGFVDRHRQLLATLAASSDTSASETGDDDGEFVALRRHSEVSVISDLRVLNEDLIENTRSGTDGLFREINILERHVKVVHRLWQHVASSDDTESVAVLYERLFSDPDAPLARQTTQSRRGKGPGPLTWSHRRKRIATLAAIWRDRLTTEHVPLLAPLGRNDVLAELKISCAAFVLSKSDGNRRAERRITNWLFDLDFFTTCALKARTSGQTVTVPAEAALQLRPTYRRV
ncbi:hypothetical protein Q8F55_008054 [Vanrija albida]|uniref:RNA-dependent RNA polymerase n=1 Tax=Vanrija albida TaxID=181172 RepID=A0ABR3PVC8_9TREE